MIKHDEELIFKKYTKSREWIKSPNLVEVDHSIDYYLMYLGRIKIVLVYYWSNRKPYRLTRGKLINDGGITPRNPFPIS